MKAYIWVILLYTCGKKNNADCNPNYKMDIYLIQHRTLDIVMMCVQII